MAKSVNEKIFKLEKRSINNEIEASTYKFWFQKIEGRKGSVGVSTKYHKKG